MDWGVWASLTHTQCRCLLCVLFEVGEPHNIQHFVVWDITCVTIIVMIGSMKCFFSFPLKLSWAPDKKVARQDLGELEAVQQCLATERDFYQTKAD